MSNDNRFSDIQRGLAALASNADPDAVAKAMIPGYAQLLGSMIRIAEEHRSEEQDERGAT